VVATGIEQPTLQGQKAEVGVKREARPEAQAAETKASPPPSFRLRPQPAQAVPQGGPSAKLAAAIGTSNEPQPGGTPRFGAVGAPKREWPKPAEAGEPVPAAVGGERPPAEAVEADAPAGAAGAETNPGHPSIPPQERFAEWGQVRAPARELARGPSLLERVTQSISRAIPERPERGPEPVAANGSAPVNARAQDEDYDIPAFLRR
jgi:hypothetical protein